MRRKRRNTKGALLAIAAVIVLAVIAVLVYRWVFVVRNVVIQGAVSVSDEEIIRASKIDMGGSIRNVDGGQIRQDLESGGKLALDGVEVQYPNTVILTVRERTRDAMVLNGGRILVMDNEGYVIEVHSSVPENSGVYVTGLDATNYRIGGKIAAPKEQLEAMGIVLRALKEQGATMYASELNVSDPMNLWITSRTGIRVELGDISEMGQKALWFRSAVADLESRGDTKGTLDVSSGTKADYKP